LRNQALTKEVLGLQVENENKDDFIDKRNKELKITGEVLQSQQKIAVDTDTSPNAVDAWLSGSSSNK